MCQEGADIVRMKCERPFARKAKGSIKAKLSKENGSRPAEQREGHKAAPIAQRDKMDSAAPPQVPKSIHAAPQHKKTKRSKTTQGPVSMAKPWGIRAKEGSSSLEEASAQTPQTKGGL